MERFLDQFRKLDKKSKRIIDDKISLIMENPYRYKKIHSHSYSKLFRVRLEVQSKQKRLIYAVVEPNVVIVCLLDRKGEYKDLEKYISKLQKT
jgi:mRNA-degrading endonuclease RelE of RelBE toxin-antitoxin system